MFSSATRRRTSRCSSRRRSHPRESARPDVGSAIVEFVLVVPLLMLLAVGVVQVALVLHARSALAFAAAEGARAGALAGAESSAGARRTRQLLDQTLPAATVREIDVASDVVDGLPVVTVTVAAELPLIGLLGPQALTVEAHALREDEP